MFRSVFDSGVSICIDFNVVRHIAIKTCRYCQSRTSVKQDGLSSVNEVVFDQ